MIPKQLILKSFSTISPYQGTAAIKEDLLNHSFLVVMEGAEFKGILTPKDIVKSPYNLVLDCIDDKPRVTPDLGVDELFRIMKQTQNTVLPVFRKDKFIGVIRRSDIMDFLIEEQWKLEVEVDIKSEALYHLNTKLINEIKDRKQVENDILELQKQVYHSQKMQAIGTLASGIAHEFNNILHIIIGKAELAVHALTGENIATRNLKDIISAGLQLKKILRQLLDFTYKTELDMRPVDLVLTVEESLKLIRTSVPKNIDFRFSPSRPSFQVRADSSQLQQVMINLCMNAAHAMNNSGGFIDIKIKETDVDILKTAYPDSPCSDYVEISVADSGSGIPPEIMDRIFDPFFTTKETGKGLGMGLAVVQSIVDAHGGALSIKNVPSSGATLSFILPIVEPLLSTNA